MIDSEHEAVNGAIEGFELCAERSRYDGVVPFLVDRGWVMHLLSSGEDDLEYILRSAIDFPTPAASTQSTALWRTSDIKAWVDNGCGS